MGEVIRLLAEQGELREVAIGESPGESPGIRIPGGVREVIGQRLNRLSELCNQTLVTAAVIGREFDFKLLRTLMDDLTETSLLELVDEALQAHVIEELPQGKERYQFSHALIQETLSGELSTSRKVRLHARIAEALEEIYGANVEARAAELAHHFVEAESVLGTEKLVHYSNLAGDRALVAYAYEEAQALFQRGLVAKGVPLEGTEPAKDAEAAALLFGLGRAQAATPGRRRFETVATMRRAFDYYAEAGDVDQAVEVVEDPLFIGGTEGGRETQVGARALQLVPQDSHAAGRLLCNYGYIIYHETAEYERAKEAFDRAIAIARHEGDTALEARALGNAAHVDTDELRWEEGLEKALQAIERAAQANEPFAEFLGQRTAYEALRAVGDFGRARIHADAGLALAERPGMTGRLDRALYFTVVVAHQGGDWRAARTYSDRALEVGPQNMLALGCRTRLEYEVGDFSQGEAYLERLVQAMRRAAPGPTQYYAIPALVIAEVSRITGDTHRFKDAEEAAGIILSSPNTIPHYDMCARIGLALMSVQRGDVTAAAEQYTALKPASGTLLALDMGTIDRRLGLLAKTMDNLDQATVHFEDALAFCRKAGYRPELAWTCHDYAEASGTTPATTSRQYPCWMRP